MPEEQKIAWDRTNIGENYPGITLPLTYSFIKDAYAYVYKKFLRLLGVRENLMTEHRYIMENMLGYIQGRVFYNIEHWYKFLQFLPGYKYNQEFFETMLDPVEKKASVDKTKIGHTDSFTILFKFIVCLILFRFYHRKFVQKFHKINKKYESIAISKLDYFKLVALFENIESDFFSIWPITIVNDFKVMIFLGLLSKFSKKFGDNESAKIMKSVYSLKNQPHSVIPLQSIIDLALVIKQDKVFTVLFQQNETQIMEQLLNKQYNVIWMKIEKYLSEYGNRSSNELKLEEPKFKEKPELFISLIKQYLCLEKEELIKLKQFKMKKQEIYMPRNLNLIDKWLLSALRSITVQGIYKREYYRISRGKAFSIARELFLEIGKRMMSVNDLKDQNDIFYLYKDEIFSYVQYHSVPADFKSIIEIRKKQFNDFASELPRKVMTTGLPNQENITFIHSHKHKQLKGRSTSKGNIKGEVIVMPSLDLNADYRGKILVTNATDPGWTIIFPLLKGVITEHGGLLSHASIIARELGIPCIVQVTDATQLIKNGQHIQMDAEKGDITLLN